jgi:hypothetical protein
MWKLRDPAEPWLHPTKWSDGMVCSQKIVEGWVYVGAGAATLVVTFASSLLVIGVLLVRLPATYFQREHPRDFWIDRHPFLRWTGLIAKNLAGVAVILLGLALSVPGIPGQGLLTILIGLMLVNFPGKRRLEVKIISRPRVLRSVNRLREHYGRPPLVLDPVPEETTNTSAESNRQSGTYP